MTKPFDYLKGFSKTFDDSLLNNDKCRNNN